MESIGTSGTFWTQLSHPAAQAAIFTAAFTYGLIWLRIFRRVGLPPFLGVLMALPPLTFFLPFYMALVSWPLEARTRRRRQRARARAHSAVRRALAPPRKRRPRSIPMELDLAEIPFDFRHPYAGRDYVPVRLQARARPDVRPF